MMRRTTVFGLSVAGLIFSVVAAATIGNAYSDQTTRVSVNAAHEAANASAVNGALSGNGRYVVFQSSATNLVPGVSGTQVYRYDRDNDEIVLVSVATTPDRGGNNVSRNPTISFEGDHVAFTSFATDLVPGGTSGRGNVLLRNMQTGRTELVSANSSGEEGDFGSALGDVAGAHQISDNGQFVVFTSFATNLVPPSNGVQHVYRKDMSAGMAGPVVRISVNDAAVAGDRSSWTPSVSRNGNVVAFRSESTNFSPLSTAGNSQVFVRDVLANRTSLESVATSGLPQPGRNSMAPALSDDGLYVAFESQAVLDADDRDNGTLDVYLRHLVAPGSTVLASRSDNILLGAHSLQATISADGRWVGYASLEDLPALGDAYRQYDVYLYDRTSQAVTLVALNDDGVQADRASFAPSLSADGGLVLFGSTATNLVAGSNGLTQLYVRNLISNLAPVVDAGPDETVNEGQWLKRFGSFGDADGSTSWTGTFDYGAGALPLGIDPAKKTWFFQHEPLVPGEYTVTLSITDNAGATGTDTFTHIVRNVAPSIQGLGGEETIYFGTTFRRNVYLADPGQSWPVPQPAETYSATLNYGDGTGTTALSGTYFTLEHTYANADTYVVTMTASDSNGGTSTASLTLHVLSYRFDWLVDGFVVGRNLPVKFTVHAPDGTFVLDESVRVDVVDAYGNVVLGPYRFGEQPSRAITASSDAYHVNVDTKGFEPGSYRLRVHFASPTLMGEFSLSSTSATPAVRSLTLR